MKSYYSIMLFIMFAVVMSVMAVVNVITSKQDLTPAEGAIVSLTILAIMLAYRLSQAEKRIAKLEDKVEKSEVPEKSKEDKKAKKETSKKG